MRRILSIILIVTVGNVKADQPEPPVVKDRRLQVSLLASEPEIVTPVGLATDDQGRLFVVESQTHARRSDYQGPPSDRIWVFDDSDADGRLDRSRVYAAGLRNALAATMSQDGSLYVVQMKSVVVLRDIDQDGVSDSSQTVLTIETENNNHHGVFLAVAVDRSGSLYVSLGNIGGKAYRVRGTDGREISGRGDTGLIIRSAVDGSNVQRFAKGFWNPCGLIFDSQGRLLATDNDPDARGPNRVLHVIEGGDYGYRSRYGGSGLHPYCSWNGELPGTLPMIAGVGEAPVGLLDGNVAALPPDYRDDLLVGVWGTHEVLRIQTKPAGSTLTGEPQPLLVGGEAFRPTSIAATTDGTIYIADWADRSYPVHGKGRIWRLSVRAGVDQQSPRRAFKSAGDRGSGDRGLDHDNLSDPKANFDAWMRAAAGSDPFLASSAVDQLAARIVRDRVTAALGDPEPRRRLAALLALREADFRLSTEIFAPLLHDPDPSIRRLAMIWAGETTRADVAETLIRSLPLQTTSAALFETFLATLAELGTHNDSDDRPPKPGSRLQGLIDRQLILRVLSDEALPTEARAMAVRYLPAPHDDSELQVLLQLVQSSDSSLAVEAIRTLAPSAAERDSVDHSLLKLAADRDRSNPVRSESIMALASLAEQSIEVFCELLEDPDPDVSLTAARALTGKIDHAPLRQPLEEKLRDAAPSVRGQLQFALRRSERQRPQSITEWFEATRAGGDAEAGRRVFFDPRVGCAKCHTIAGRGGELGPDLSHVAAAKNSRQILTSILDPSRDRSPDYQGYLVVMQDGRVFKGTQFHYRGEAAELYLEDGQRIRFQLADTEDYRPLATSLMPEDLVETMSVEELTDLLAYLRSLE